MKNTQKVLLTREQKNEKYKHTSLEMETSTHFPMLIKVLQMSEGPVLEMGSGMFSTPLLHWLCDETQRSLLTIEHYRHYFEFAKKFETGWHEVRFVKPTDIFKPEGRYGVVFIDHSPKKPRTRGDDALMFKDCADYVVLHDAGLDGHKKYGYDQLYSQFKYRHDWDHCWPSTTVLSNFKDLSNLQ